MTALAVDGHTVYAGAAAGGVWKWTDAGVGNVFESTDGGGTWVDRSGDMPDAPVNKVVLWHGSLVVATDVGVFKTPASAPGSWIRLGNNLPAASANDLAVSPDGKTLLVFTHGRGAWSMSAG